VNCCVTSPPYFGLRDYGHEGQIGLEETPEAFVQKMVEVFREVNRVLRDDGTLWLNLGDSYAGSGKGRNGDGSPNVDPLSKQATSAGTIIGKLIKSQRLIVSQKI
jgi:DNA modification methylase